MISQTSDVLQGLVGGQCELYLDQFTGEIEGIQDTVELLYGGEVGLTECNIKTVLKFSVVYCVKEMFELCREWLKQNVSAVNLFSFIELGLLVQRVGSEDYGVLDIFKRM